MPSGGIYILEDMETFVDTDLYPGYDDCEMSAYDVCRAIADVVMSKRPCTSGLYTEQITEIGMRTEMISMIKGSCVFIKR